MKRNKSRKPKYRRILIKLSGETLGDRGFGFSAVAIQRIVQEIISIHELGVQIMIVVGGGNIIRGTTATSLGIDRPTGDTMGMLGTVINSIALCGVLEKAGIQTRVQTAIDMPRVSEPAIRRRAIRHLEKGRVVIFGAGTGNPFVSTDTAAALRSSETNAEIILKATKVDGIYDKDPKKFSSATMFQKISFQEVLDRRLEVMDLAAFAMCRENRIPIIVFDFFKQGNLRRVVCGDQIGTLVHL
ncbi:MAG: hypothetical protein RIT04_87 [Candidatus Parcubacteria bacterium]|jgi:uridylate kinase